MSASTPPQEWATHLVQLIVFPIDPKAGMEQEWFELVTGVVPETTKTRTRREDEAEIDGRHVSLVSELGKITWSELIVIKADDPPQEMPSNGPFDEACRRFTSLASKWWDSCPAIWRIGFAAKIVIPAKDRIESYDILAKCLAKTVVIDAINSSDFNYRINRPIPSSKVVVGRTINRLVTWSAMKLELSVRTSSSPDGSPVISDEIYGCLAQMDINTGHECKDQIASDKLPNLWQELIDFGAEIAKNGDVP